MKLPAFFDYIISQLRIHVSHFLRSAKPLDQRYPQFQIGRGCYGPIKIETFGDDSTLRMGCFCSIAPNVTVLLGGEHRFQNISSYPFDLKYFQPRPDLPRSHYSKGDVIIGNDVWIGHGSLILSGSQIGDGAVIGACTLVRGEIPPYAIAVGNPAKVIKFRFDSPSIQRLLDIQWWNWHDDAIDRARPLLLANDLEAFFSLAQEIKVNAAFSN